MKKVVNQTLSIQIVEYVKELLLSGELAPGDKITELSLANALSISQPPVREAMQILIAEGFVETKGKRGRYITKMSPKNIRDSYFTGGMIEAGVVSYSLHLFTDKDIENIEKIVLKMKKYADDTIDADIDDIAQLDIEFHNYLFSLSDNATARKLWFRCCQSVGKYFFYQRWKEMHTSMEKYQRHKIILDAIKSKDARLVQDTILEHYTSAGEIISQYAERLDASSQ